MESNEDNIRAALNKKLCELSFYEFFQQAWETVEPSVPLSTNWHHKYLCDILQEEAERITEGKEKTKDIVINVPFRSTKSLIVTVLFPVWSWIHNPKLRFITSSYSADLSVEHATKSRDVINSKWFQDRWKGVFHIKKDQNLKSRYENNFLGGRRSTSVGGTITGQGGDFLIIDDPVSPKNAASEVERENANEWYKTTLYSRLNNPLTGVRIIIMQRIHENDLSGFLVDGNTKDNYRHICIPAELSRDLKPDYLEKYYDKEGLFWSDRFSRKILDDYRDALGSYGYAGQLMQIPTPLDSGMIRADWFKIDTEKQIDEKTIINFIIDPAYTANEKNDPSALLAYTYKDNHWQIIDCVNVHKEFPELIRFIPEWCKKNGYTNRSKIFVEPKASGKSIVQTLQRETGLNVKEDKPPTKDKVARVQDISAALETGRVSLYKGKWNEDFVHQCVKFPSGKHDDMVDCLVMAVNREMANGGKVLFWS